MHYRRWYRRGDPLISERPTRPMLDRCLDKIDFTTSLQGCWLWTGAKAGKGYGAIWQGSSARMTYAHRAIYESMIGAIPDELELDHLCRNHACVNPDHLEPVTHSENLRRGYRARRGHT
jgi:hypothetical protein